MAMKGQRVAGGSPFAVRGGICILTADLRRPVVLCGSASNVEGPTAGGGGRESRREVQLRARTPWRIEWNSEKMIAIMPTERIGKCAQIQPAQSVPSFQ